MQIKIFFFLNSRPQITQVHLQCMLCLIKHLWPFAQAKAHSREKGTKLYLSLTLVPFSGVSLICMFHLEMWIRYRFKQDFSHSFLGYSVKGDTHAHTRIKGTKGVPSDR